MGIFEFLLRLLDEDEKKQRDKGKKNMKDITDYIERRKDLEERLGYEFKGLFACIGDDGYVKVNGEIHAMEGREPDCSCYITVSAKDEEGRVLHVERDYLNSKDFYMFRTFYKNFTLKEFTPSLRKILVYMEKC